MVAPHVAYAITYQRVRGRVVRPAGHGCQLSRGSRYLPLAAHARMQGQQRDVATRTRQEDAVVSSSHRSVVHRSAGCRLRGMDVVPVYVLQVLASPVPMGQGDSKYAELKEHETVEEVHPRCLSIDVDDDPYSVLTRIGAIRRRARIGGKNGRGGDLVEQDDDGKWVYPSSRQRSSDDGTSDPKGKLDLWDRHDIQPHCVIRVVGNAQFQRCDVTKLISRELEALENKLPAQAYETQELHGRLATEDEELRARCELTSLLLTSRPGPQSPALDVEAKEVRVRAKHEALELKARSELMVRELTGRAPDALLCAAMMPGDGDMSETESVNDEKLPPCAEGEDDHRKWVEELDDADIVPFMKQYLSCSIPAAARALNALVIVSDTVQHWGQRDPIVGHMSTYIEKGLSRARRNADKKAKHELQDSGVRNSDLFLSRPLAVGVHRLVNLAPLWMEADDSHNDDADHAERVKHEVRDSLPSYDAHIFPVDKLTQHTKQDARIPSFLSGITACLEEGHTRSSDHDNPFRMKTKGTVYVLFGGVKGDAALEVLQACMRRSTVLVIEGSGGYADTLANTITGIQKMVGNDDNEYQGCLGTLSPRTSQIISSGCLQRVPKGTTSQAFQTMVQKAAIQDESLHNAWKKYAVWDYNANYCRKVFMCQQLVILSLGILVIAFSTVQTFIQLQYPEDVAQSDSTTTKSYVRSVYTWLGLIVVVLPVGLSLVEAIENRMKCGGRWVALRSVSETMLREIYIYRTRSRQYSDSAVRRAARAKSTKKKKAEKEVEQEDDSADEKDSKQHDNRLERKVQEHMTATDDTPYKTRQEKLGQWIDQLVNTVKVSDCQDESLHTYTGQVPPVHAIAGDVDDGYSYLTPDQYIERRLLPLMKRYETAARHYERQVRYYTYLNYVVGTLGALLAALSSVPTLTTYNVQAWVALTTGVSNALTRYMDYSRMEFLAKKSSKVKMDLSRVQSWWDSRGSEAESQECLDTLVKKVEGLVTGEFIEWTGQMKKAMEKSKKAKKDKADKNTAAAAALFGGAVDENASKLKALGLTDINADTLAAAFQDPNGPAAQKIMDSTERLKQRIEHETVKKVKSVVKSVLPPDFEAKFPDFVDEAGRLRDVNLGGMLLGGYVPDDVRHFLSSAKHRRKMFAEIVKLDGETFYGALSRDQCLELFQHASEDLKTKVSKYSHRQMLESLKFSVVEQLQEDLEDGLQKCNVGLYDLAPRKEKIEMLLMELRDVCETDWRKLDSKMIVSKIKDKEIQQGMDRLNEVALRGIMKRAKKMFDSPQAKLLSSLMAKIASLDVEELLNTSDLRAETYDLLENFEGRDGEERFLTQQQLLMCLPASVRTQAAVVNKSQAQLAGYVRAFKNGFSAGVSVSLGRGLRTVATDLFDSFIRDRTLMVRVVYAMKLFSQCDINKDNKKTLMRKLTQSPAVRPERVEKLWTLDEPELKKLMSWVKWYMSSSYQAHIFDNLCDSITEFDLRNWLTDAEDRDKLVSQLVELKDKDNAALLDRREFMSALGYRSLVAKFVELKHEHVQDILRHLKVIIGCRFYAGVFGAALSNFDEKLAAFDRKALIGDLGIQTLCIGVMQYRATDLQAMDDESFPNSIVPTRLMLTLGLNGKQAEIVKLSKKVREFLDERVLAGVFSVTARGLARETEELVSHTFALPGRRNAIINGLTALVAECSLEKIGQMDEKALIDRMGGLLTKANGKGYFSEIIAEFAARLPVGKFSRVIVLLLNEVILRTPYLVFQKLCTDSRAGFDLRGLVDEPRTRRLFPAVLLKCKHRVKGKRSAADILRYCQKEGTNATTLTSTYNDIIHDMRQLTDKQMEWFTLEVLNFFEVAPVGQLFARYHTAHFTKTSIDYSVLVEAASSIRNSFASNQQTRANLLNDMKNFDANLFFVVLTDNERLEVLTKYIEDSGAARAIAAYSNAQLRVLFAHLRHTCAQVDDSKDNV